MPSPDPARAGRQKPTLRGLPEHAPAPCDPAAAIHGANPGQPRIVFPSLIIARMRDWNRSHSDAG
jgi:hypothetical protein